MKTLLYRKIILAVGNNYPLPPEPKKMPTNGE